MRKADSIRALEMALQREAFGRHLRHLRQQRALSQEAAAYEMGVSAKSLHNWEAGLSTPNPASMRLLARFYSEPLAELTSYIPDYRREEPPGDRLDRIEERLGRIENKLDELLAADGGDATDAARRAATAAQRAAAKADAATAPRRASPRRKGRPGRAA